MHYYYNMNIIPALKPLTIPEFLDWVQSQEKGRYELVRGKVVVMAPERAAHVRAKQRIAVALSDAIRRAGVACEAFVDGLAVVIDDETCYEPDALVNCGAAIAPDSMIAPNPVIVVEVLSPSTGKIDKTVKRADYFRVPAVMHYVIVDLIDRRVLHDRRLPNGDIGPAVVTGELVFDPPGITIAVESFLD